MTNKTMPTKESVAAFIIWYDAKSKDYQELIDIISDKTSFITDEVGYDSFIEMLTNYGIKDAEQFEDAFESESEGCGEKVTAEFAEEYAEDCGCYVEPDFFANCIDWNLVWMNQVQTKFLPVEFEGNTYFFIKPLPAHC